jgi:hypothetical protein
MAVLLGLKQAKADKNLKIFCVDLTRSGRLHSVCCCLNAGSLSHIVDVALIKCEKCMYVLCIVYMSVGTCTEVCMYICMYICIYQNQVTVLIICRMRIYV